MDLYEDIAGKYFPKLEDDNNMYHERKDGMVERVKLTDADSVGRTEACRRGALANCRIGEACRMGEAERTHQTK